MVSILSGVLSLVFAVILITSVLIPTIKDANTTSWTTAETTIFGLASLAAIFGLVNGIANLFGLGY